MVKTLIRKKNSLGIVKVEPFIDPIFVGKPNVVNRKKFMCMVEDILDRRWYTNNGKYVKRLEKKIAAYLGVDHCVAVCNATIGLEILFQVLKLKGNVIAPSFTFVATAHALTRMGLDVRFCDIDPYTHNLDPQLLEELIDENTTAILGVHVWGRPCPTEQILTIARKHKIRIIYDAAHAFCCSHNKQLIGSFGDAEVFSFHATKFFNTFEGGAITTGDEELAHALRAFRNFGFSGIDRIDSLGTNAKMGEINAAMGLSLLSRIDDIICINKKHYQLYRERLSIIPGVKLVEYNSKEKNNYQYIVLEVNEFESGLGRDVLVDVLHAHNVIARRYFYPGCHKSPPYMEANANLPETDILCKKTILLPNGNSITNKDISKICDIIDYAIRK